MDDVHEALSAVRRDQRRIEDDVALLNRKKASTDDFELLSKKQNDTETEHRTKMQSVQSELQTLNENIRKLVTAVEALSEDLTRHKRKTANELEEIASPAKGKGGKSKDDSDDKPKSDRPFLPMQLQITLYVLAGVGLMALVQNAPAAMRTLPHITAFGGG